MRIGYTLSIIVLLAILDIVIYTLVDDWTNIAMVSAISMNVAFGIGIGFTLASPKGRNGDVFALSSIILVIIFVIISAALTFIFILMDFEESLVITVEIIYFIVEVAVFAFNLHANMKTAESDKLTDERMSSFRSIQNTLEDAMDLCDDKKMMREIEIAYDAVRSMTSPKSKDVENLNITIAGLANQILIAVRDKEDVQTVRILCTDLKDTVTKRERTVRNR